MLRLKDVLGNGRSPRAALMVLLLTSALIASAVPSPAQKSDNSGVKMSLATCSAIPPVLEGQQVNTRADVKLKAAGREPFDLSYLPEDPHCVIVLRPAAIFAQPGMNKFTTKFHEFAAVIAARVGLKGEIALHVEDIDWMMLAFSRDFKGSVNIKGADDHKNLVLGSGGEANFVIHTVKDFDWLKHIKRLVPSLEEVHRGNRTFYYIPQNTFSMQEYEVPFVIPDRRTITFFTTGLPDAGPRKLPAWLTDWGHVERDTFAIALDGKVFVELAKSFAQIRNQMDPEIADSVTKFLATAAKIKSVVLGFDSGDDLYFKGFARGVTKDTVAKITESMGIGLKECVKQLNETKDKETKILNGFGAHFLANSQWTWSSKMVQWHSKVEVNLPDLLNSLQDAAESKPTVVPSFPVVDRYSDTAPASPLTAPSISLFDIPSSMNPSLPSLPPPVTESIPSFWNLPLSPGSPGSTNQSQSDTANKFPSP
jgi:hypothetical protein